MTALPLHVLGSGASAAAGSSSGGGGSITSLLLIVVIIVFGGFLLFNGRRRARAVQTQQAEIAIGATIVTRAGMIATLVHRTEHYVVLQLDDGTRTRFVPQAVARVWEEPSDTAGDAAGEIEADDSPHPEPPASGGPLAD